MYDSVLIFTHFGNSRYLEYTLSCARRTNPQMRMVLLGDEENRRVAERNGWEHVLFELCESRLHSRFLRAYRPIQGEKHNSVRNGRDWLKFVFERWFYIEGFLSAENITRFWHFDSDTMILQNLMPYAQELADVDFSVQCNNTCLNGIVTAVVVSEFCNHMCTLFEDEDFLAVQQSEFDSIHPGFAFTEMRAFEHYKNNTRRPWVHLLNYRQDKSFDDCICQDHGFEMTQLNSGEQVKNLFSRNGKVYGVRDGSTVELVTLNLSWVPDYVFQWAFGILDGRETRLDQAPCPVRLKLLGMFRRMRRLVTRVSV